MIKRLFIGFIGVVSFFSTHLINAQTNNISDLFKERGELYFSFENPGHKMVQQLSSVISIDHFNEEKVFAYANKNEMSEFLTHKLSFEPLTPPSKLTKAKMKTWQEIQQIKEINDWDYYPDYDAYVSMMYQFETDFPELCRIESIGQSIEGRELLFAIISDSVNQTEPEAQFMYTGTIHGDETAGYVLSLRLIDYLLNNYGSDTQVDNLVNNLEIWINPLANPDGTFYGGNSSVNGAIRYNANYVDLNRNYPDPEDGPHPDGNEWQTETIHFMNLAENQHFISSANFHGGAEVCNYPWDTWAQLHPDNDWWYYVCREYADTAHVYAPGSYMNGFDNGITNGYQWYTISGGRQDYMNFFHQCREFTLELSDVKLLPASQLPALWEYNYRSLLNYMEQSTFGVRGVVTDATTGNPVKAKIFIDGHDADSSWIYSNESDGTFYRLLFEGTYDITFSAYGYYPITIENVEVENREITDLDVQLTGGDLIVDFSASQTTVPIGSTVDFSDESFGNITSWSWEFEGGNPVTSNDQNPQNILYSDEGTYDVTLTISDGSNSQTITKEDFINVSVEFLMQTTTVTTCTGAFYDTGGLGENYGDNEDIIMTFLPESPNGKIIAEFSSFNVEYESSCDYDYLEIYDGTSTSASLIGTYCGTNSPGTITASNSDGALTFVFHSDYSVTEAGWVASISCENAVLPPVADFTANNTYINGSGTVSFTDMSGNDPTEWSWTFEGGEPSSSSEQNPEILYAIPGIYDVTLTASNAGGSNTITKEDYIEVVDLTGLSKENICNISVYPNPATEFIYFNSDHQIGQIKMMDLTGRTIASAEPESKQSILRIGEIDNGVYLVLIIINDHEIIRKIIIEN